MKTELKKIENIREFLNPDARYYDKRNDGYYESEQKYIIDFEKNILIAETIRREFYEVPKGVALNSVVDHITGKNSGKNK